jgi:hypothetical protein
MTRLTSELRLLTIVSAVQLAAEEADDEFSDYLTDSYIHSLVGFHTWRQFTHGVCAHGSSHKADSHLGIST